MGSCGLSGDAEDVVGETSLQTIQGLQDPKSERERQTPVKHRRPPSHNEDEETASRQQASRAGPEASRRQGLYLPGLLSLWGSGRI